MPDRSDMLPEKLNSASVGYTLRFYRRCADMSVREMARRLNVNSNAIYRWENGRGPIPSDHLVRYLSVLELNLFVDDKNNEPVPTEKIS